MKIGAVAPAGLLGDESSSERPGLDPHRAPHGGHRGWRLLRAAAATAALAVGLAGGVAAVSMGEALAFELKEDASGALVRWQKPVVSFVIDSRRAEEVEPATTIRGIKAAFAAWGEVLGPRLRFQAAGDTLRPIPGFDREPGAVNENAVIFSRDAWPFEGSEALMMTVTTYRSGGFGMVDADIVVNERDHRWSDGQRDRNDLQNALTHEVGHLLGLGHSVDPDATMFARAGLGETHKRQLHNDDRAAIDALYGLEGAPPMPAQDPEEEVIDPALAGCAQAPGAAAPGSVLLMALALIFGFAARRHPHLLPRCGPDTSGPLARSPRWLAAFGGLASLVGLAGLLGLGSVRAASLEALPVDALTARATLVAEGVVIERRSAWEGQLIFTHTTVAVRACWAGSCPSVLQLRTPGGTVEDLVMSVDGAATLALGEMVVVFAAPSEAVTDRLRVVGHALGKFSVVEVDGALVAVRDLRHVHLSGPAPGLVEGENRLALAELWQRVRASRVAPAQYERRPGLATQASVPASPRAARMRPFVPAPLPAGSLLERP